MSNRDKKQQNDPLLHPYLLAGDETDAEDHLTRLLNHVEPIIRNQVRKHQYPELQIAQEDLEQDARYDILTWLRTLKSTSATPPIENFRGYATMIVQRCISNQLRANAPWRKHLRRKLKFELQEQGSFVLWGEAICGFVDWQGQAPESSEKLTRLRDNLLELFVSSKRTSRQIEELDLAEVLAEIFNYVGHPLRYKDLEKIVVELCGLDRKPANLSDDGVSDHLAQETMYEPDPENPEDQARRREFLRWLWSEVCTLPDEQRAVYLLSMEATLLLWESGVVSLSQIAAQLKQPIEKFAALWNDLPLSDQAIAELVGLKSDQVKNRRTKARERLQRHWQKYEAPEVTSAAS